MEKATTCIRVAPRVAEALAAGRPVVALETTVIAHGIPRPRNLALARALEAAVRERGALPATIGVVDGRVVAGLDDAQLERLATAENVAKCSTADLAAVVARGGLGATTAAATLHVAGRVGIRFMATGGVGGVHRGGETSLDVSADLGQLARSPVVVVCSGPKILLDLPRTLEKLETLGVTIVGYRTGELPAFYCTASGLAIPRVDGPDEVAALVRAQEHLGWPSGILLAVPPPAELALPRAEIEAMLAEALAAARAAGASAKAETPFVLRRLAEASGGRTVALNEALILANATLAAVLAGRCAESYSP